MKSTDFCSCTYHSCPHHPGNHDQGCTPCIEKNLRLREIPSCFFNLVDPAHQRTDDHFEDFAHFVLTP